MDSPPPSPTASPPPPSPPPSPPPLRPIHQDDVFYILPWERHLETNVLASLSEEKGRGMWVYGDEAGNMQCLERVKVMIEATQQIYIPIDEYVRKVLEWETRFNCFSMLLEMYGMFHDRYHNSLNGSDETWRQIQVERPHLMCYYEEGEADFYWLKDIFTPEPKETTSEELLSDSSVESDEYAE